LKVINSIFWLKASAFWRFSQNQMRRLEKYISQQNRA